MIAFGERCYSHQYDEISDDEFSDDEISGFANTTKFLATKFLPPFPSTLERLDKTLFFLASYKPLEFLDMNLFFC